MIEWTRDKRYQKREDISERELTALAEQVRASRWRLHFHIQPPTGLLNDPNGLCQYNGVYHLFYQWFPLGPVHGLKYWYHLTSTDLVHWQSAESIIAPDTPFDKEGAYSGSAVVEADGVYLFYTGNVRDEQWERSAYQMIAKLSAEGTITKHPRPVIMAPPAGYTAHFRDPKVWREAETYFMIIGAQRTDETGCILRFCSQDKYNWAFQGELNLSEAVDGFMWECPDLFGLDGADVLLFCPQGYSKLSGPNTNIYPSVYTLGTFDQEMGTFNQAFDCLPVDAGFDFYAPQTFETEKGERVLFGWMGLPEVDEPSFADGWAHCMSLPRVLTVREGRLIQKPAPALQLLRGDEQSFTMKGRHLLEGGALAGYELVLNLIQPSGPVVIQLYQQGEERFTFTYDATSKEVTIDRSSFRAVTGAGFGQIRRVRLHRPLQQLHVFRDTTSIEIFINDGEHVMSSRFYPEQIVGDIDIVVEGTATVQHAALHKA